MQISQLSHYPQSVVEPRSTEEFGEDLISVMNQGALGLMISVGHRTGLWEELAGSPPRTSPQIATDAGLEERYVREWLSAMVTARVICYSPDEQLFWLPDSHAELLTGTVDNFSATTQWLAVLAGVEGNVVDAFRHGGGVHYHCFHRFHEVMATESSQTVVAALEDHILPLDPDLAQRLAEGMEVLDVGCGSGHAMIALATRYPASRFTGLDLCDDAIAAARKRAEESNLENVNFEIRDVTDLGASSRFDLITAFDSIHDQREPAVVLEQIRKALKPTGVFLMQDIRASSILEKNLDNPLSTFLYTISTMHCMTVSLAQGGEGLGTCWGRELALEMLETAGFDDVRLEELEHDIMNDYYICRATGSVQG